LEQLGAKIVVAQADVSQREQLTQVLGGIEQSLPPLRGVIHAAGLLDDGVLRQLDWERLEKVMAPKVEGAWNLHLLTQDKPLDFFILFSSAASLLGSPGQGNHMAANTFLDVLAHYRQKLGLPGLSINWGAWSEIGAAAKRQAETQIALKGVGAIAPHQGLQILEALMQESSAQVGVVPINWSQFLEAGIIPSFFEDFSQRTGQHSEEQPEFLQQLQATPPEERRACLAAHIRVQIAKVLGFSPSEVDMQKGFFDLGMDSLTSVELKNRLQNSLGCSLSSTVAFDYPTVEALVDYLAQEVLDLSFDAEAGETDSLAELSQDDIADLLAQELLEIEQGKKP
jgi:acyl carrier protein